MMVFPLFRNVAASGYHMHIFFGMFHGINGLIVLLNGESQDILRLILSSMLHFDFGYTLATHRYTHTHTHKNDMAPSKTGAMWQLLAYGFRATSPWCRSLAMNLHRRLIYISVQWITEKSRNTMTREQHQSHRHSHYNQLNKTWTLHLAFCVNNERIYSLEMRNT